MGGPGAMSQSDSILRHRVQTELREIAQLLDAAENIATGLLDLLDHVYNLDSRTKNALAAANQLTVVLREEHDEAERRADA
jgi:hypothetical protein